jgi:S1-C subfamily serine protease
MTPTLQRLWTGLLLLFFISACSPTRSTFVQATPSTPIADLPVAVFVATPNQLPTALPAEIISVADADYLLLSNVYERVSPSVVNIEAHLNANDANNGVARGSGFIVDTDGHILTNAHVINNAASVRVTFHDGYAVEAQIVGVDSYSDLGVVRVSVNAERLQTLTLVNSDSVRVGQRAITIGNPFGLSSSMSVGIISGIGRTLRSAELIDNNALRGFQNPSIIQTDTPINPGNSGGPLLNSDGMVIGVTTAIRTDTGIFQGVGFAVPSNTINRILPQLIRDGRAQYPWLGISVTPEDNGFGVGGLADVLNLPVQRGVLIRGITVGSPSDLAGLRGGNEVITVRGTPVCLGGDIIVAVNDTYVGSMDELVAYLIENTTVNQVVTLRVIRDKQTFDLPVSLQARPESSGEVRDCVR